MQRTGRRAPRRGEKIVSYRFGHVLLWVKDEAASKDFYVNKLGFILLNDDNESSLYTVGTPGSFVLSFHKMGLDEDGTGMTVDASGARNVHFDFDVPDVDFAYTTLLQRGVKFISPPRDMPWGERHTWLYDPDGYIVGLSSPIRRNPG